RKQQAKKFIRHRKFFSVNPGVLLPGSESGTPTPSPVIAHSYFALTGWASRLDSRTTRSGCVLGVHGNAFFGVKDLVHNLVHT
ncbi:MAG: hypothetical protein WBV48_19255, partial [Candidatus Acidiferrales bacterium]